jgi:hypothetical protein
MYSDISSQRKKLELNNIFLIDEFKNLMQNKAIIFSVNLKLVYECI